MNFKNIKFKKKTLIIALVACLACLAVYLNWSYQQGKAEDAAAAAASDYEAVEDRRILGEVSQVDASINGKVSDTATPDKDAVTYFADTRLSRQKARDEAISILESTAVSATDETKTSLSAQIAELAKNTLVESRIEGLVTAKGYADCVAFINDEGVNVIVSPPAGGLAADDVAKIMDIVTAEANVDADTETIKIVEAK